MNPSSPNFHLQSPDSHLESSIEDPTSNVHHPSSTIHHPPSSLPVPEVLRAALTLLTRLDSHSPSRSPSLITIFQLYCVRKLTVRQVAQRCHCSVGTVANRLARLRAATGLEPKVLQLCQTSLSDEFEHSESPQSSLAQ